RLLLWRRTESTSPARPKTAENRDVAKRLVGKIHRARLAGEIDLGVVRRHGDRLGGRGAIVQRDAGIDMVGEACVVVVIDPCIESPGVCDIVAMEHHIPGPGKLAGPVLQSNQYLPIAVTGVDRTGGYL